MMRTLTVVRQYLAAAFLIVIGLIAYGCGDSATVNPEAALGSLKVNNGPAEATLEPSFNPATTSYTVNLSNNVTRVTITAQPGVAGDTVTIDGQTTGSREIDLGPTVRTLSTKDVRIDVSNPPSSSRTYTIEFKRAGLDGNNSLRSLTVSPETPPIAFNKDTLIYTVSVLNSVDRVTVTPTLDDPAAATMTVNGQSAISAQARTITLSGPSQTTTIPIVVTAQNSDQRIYTVNVIRAALGGNNNLSGLTVSPGPLDGPFNANDLSYTVNVASTVTSVTVTPRLQAPIADPTATLTVTSNGPQPITTSGQARTIRLRDAGLSTTINILVRAPNGSQKPYTITVDRAAPPPPSGNNNLSALTVRLSTSSPNLISFSPITTSYTVDVGSGVGTITVTPGLQAPIADPAATLAVTSNGPGPITTSGQSRTIPLRAAGLSTTINIVVRAPNGSEKPYTITVDREAPPPPSGNNNLSALTVTPPGTPLPGFNSSTLTYTVNVGGDVQNVTVTATLQATAASMIINGTGTSSGVASAPITLGGPGSSTGISILVIAPNGSTKTYTVTVNKRPPAPDLIEADDTCKLDDTIGGDPTQCLPGTSREDNITNRATPTFSMLLPSGPGPSLFVDGSTVASEFDQSANTLKPTTPLPDGPHSIRYTVTNSAGLVSAQSDPLEVTIDTTAPGN
ncbi:MAG: cadherin-like beta sandwich domain-containing protein [Nitrospira sp.]|nr:cadherin-like beta sandwich domain-containing protein [Nitrospira sp.]MDH4341459.1 cadherin-like beta sandwich domain-containing protein [Nitrospira sp.]MDH5337164.1 cadherin-like beta sandwich domain-containing protein [Nitrospira sp.]